MTNDGSADVARYAFANHTFGRDDELGLRFQFGCPRHKQQDRQDDAEQDRLVEVDGEPVSAVTITSPAS